MLDSDSRFCWDQVVQQDPWFRLHYLFAPSELADPILALHALFAMTNKTLALSEESLTLAQLQWWRDELGREKAGISKHPVIRHLRESHSGFVLSDEVVDLLVAQVLLRLQSKTVPDEAALRILCHQVGKARVSAEFELQGANEQAAIEDGALAGLGLAVLWDFAVRNPRSGFWFLPLDVQARFQVGTEALGGSGQKAKSALGYFQDLGSQWSDAQIESILHLEAASEFAGVLQKHLLAMTMAWKLRLSGSIRDMLRGGDGEPGRWKLMDPVKVWAVTRRV